MTEFDTFSYYRKNDKLRKKDLRDYGKKTQFLIALGSLFTQQQQN
jgi:hypothetical protein